MSRGLISDFACGMVEVETVGRSISLEPTLGEDILEALVSIGMVGEIFWKFFSRNGQGIRRIPDALHDGSARDFVQAYHEEEVQSWDDLVKQARAVGDEEMVDEASGCLHHALMFYQTADPDRATVLARELGLELAPAA